MSVKVLHISVPRGSDDARAFLIAPCTFTFTFWGVTWTYLASSVERQAGEGGLLPGALLSNVVNSKLYRGSKRSWRGSIMHLATQTCLAALHCIVPFSSSLDSVCKCTNLAANSDKLLCWPKCICFSATRNLPYGGKGGG